MATENGILNSGRRMSNSRSHKADVWTGDTAAPIDIGPCSCARGDSLVYSAAHEGDIRRRDCAVVIRIPLQHAEIQLAAPGERVAVFIDKFNQANMVAPLIRQGLG